ncbi:MAG: hypothetical protein QOG55_3889 [Acidobacteriaceae bacterium]|jgi:hypothetical protein|nr:hypothetical protein [Acidobacteriaceae bacterium]
MAANSSIASISPAATKDEYPTHSTSVRLERADLLLLLRSVAPRCGSRRHHHPPVSPTGACRPSSSAPLCRPLCGSRRHHHPPVIPTGACQPSSSAPLCRPTMRITSPPPPIGHSDRSVPTRFFCSALSPRYAVHVATTTHRSFRPEQTEAFSFLIRSCE